MGIQSEVTRLADLVAQVRSPLSIWEDRLHEALRQIGEVEVDWWEHRYRHVHWHGAREQKLPLTPTVVLFDAVFEFGSFNLYGQFDEAGTRRAHTELISMLVAGLGVEVDAGLAPTDW